MSLEIRWLGPAPVDALLEEAAYLGERDLRYRVLRAPLGMPRGSEENKSEARCHHGVALREGRVVGCVLMLEDGEASAKLLQMAVDPTEQGRGTGALLVRSLEARARGLGVREVHMHARETALGFYEKLGYAVFGEPFTEVGLPHRYMSRAL